VDEEVATRRAPLLAALLVGAGVAVVLGVYGRVHHANSHGLPAFGFSSPLVFKVWFGSAVMLLAIVQLILASWMYGRLPGAGEAPAWVGTAHRASGYTALVLSLPVAALCLYGFGFNPSPFSGRVLLHSIAGCLFYGAYAAKIIIVRSSRLPGWAIPLIGSILFTVIVLLWLSSAVWYVLYHE
jgi:hypothetical protein